MAELLSTVLLTYSVFTIGSWWIDGLDRDCVLSQYFRFLRLQAEKYIN